MKSDSNLTCNPTRSHEDYYTALYQAALTISSSLELTDVLQSVVKSITEAMRVKACVLRLLDPRTGQLQLSAVYGLSSGYLAKGPVDVEHSPIDSEVLSGKKRLSMAMVQRLRARFRVPADVLLPPPGKLKAKRARKRKAA